MGCSKPLYSPYQIIAAGVRENAPEELDAKFREAGKALTERTLSLTRRGTVAENTAQR